ncbi:hypothetical protein DPM13_00405 [Paracoccus mutanolyticus]|uniref:Uncharacterized protein n=1 Tax=Paracoccus mutanolyticus TaxID=1499308 RepID=A0ABM6WP71_9RHOB|nr:TrbG/VirB9 family P-type conjugative transfer protein [Paracoccus mutanolyticus]AWX92276.1 hypothetical protein DPM13_00405 [Paracoccus mutanolyticus]
MRNMSTVDGQVYDIQTRIRNITLIELGPGEQIRSVAAGDLESFKVEKLEGPNVFTIKPVVEGAAEAAGPRSARSAFPARR